MTQTETGPKSEYEAFYDWMDENHAEVHPRDEATHDRLFETEWRWFVADNECTGCGTFDGCVCETDDETGVCDGCGDVLAEEDIAALQVDSGLGFCEQCASVDPMAEDRYADR